MWRTLCCNNLKEITGTSTNSHNASQNNISEPEYRTKLTTIRKHHTWKEQGGRMVVGFTTTYAINAYHHTRCKSKSRS